jgi:hypothetical protein
VHVIEQSFLQSFSKLFMVGSSWIDVFDVVVGKGAYGFGLLFYFVFVGVQSNRTMSSHGKQMPEG